MKACVFLGPTLRADDVTALLDAICLPPVRQGDVYRAVSRMRPPAIGIIDGYFQGVPSVWHKEVLWAMEQGVHVFGAASMGALRAAELHSFGMRGVGRVFEAYRDGVLDGCGEDPFEDDDEVAVIHGPAETGYISASEAMVNIRCTLFAAEDAGVIDPKTRDCLLTIGKTLFFADRSYGAILVRGREALLPANQLAGLQAWLPAGRIDQKQRDALAMLEAMRDLLADHPGRMRAAYDLEYTSMWDRAVAALQPPPAQHDAEQMMILDELRLDPSRFLKLRVEIVGTLSGRSRLEPAPSHGCSDAGGDPRVESGQRMQSIESQIAFQRVEDAIPPFVIERQMLAQLHATGEHEPLLARARDKHARLARCTDSPQAHTLSPLDLLRFQNWFFTELQGADIPDDLDSYLREAGHPDEASFNAAIVEEYLYREMIEPPAKGEVDALTATQGRS